MVKFAAFWRKEDPLNHPGLLLPDAIKFPVAANEELATSDGDRTADVLFLLAAHLVHCKLLEGVASFDHDDRAAMIDDIQFPVCDGGGTFHFLQPDATAIQFLIPQNFAGGIDAGNALFLAIHDEEFPLVEGGRGDI